MDVNGTLFFIWTMTINDWYAVTITSEYWSYKYSTAHYLRLGGRRYLSSVSEIKQDVKKAHSFKKAWLQDPSTYPIMVVLGFACCLATGFMYYKLTRCDDVRITSKAKGQVLRTWSDADKK
jgi:NADH-ubiquinone reductase complex 1 MLRQ subunit